MSEFPPPAPVSPPPVPPTSTFDLNAWFSIWKRALTQPSAATFEELERHPLVTMQNSLIWNAITGAIGGFLGSLIGLATTRNSAGSIFSSLGIGPTGGFGNVIAATILGAIGSVVGLLIFAVIVSAICRAQGGTGTFQTQVALLGTFTPPLFLVSLILGQIPILGGIIGFVLAIYQLYLYIVATQAAQNVTMGKAAIAVLLPGLLILCCVIVAVFGLIAALVPWFRTTGML